MAKRYKRDKVIRGYDGIDREESTAGLMALRVLIILIIIVFIVGSVALFVYNFMKETENVPQSPVSKADTGAFYQRYDTDVSESLLEYCNNSVSIGEYSNAELVSFDDKIQVNVLMKDSLDRMIEAARTDGINLQVMRGYMSYEECSAEYQIIRIRLEQEGATLSESDSKARAIFPPGGSNEYQTGMLIKLSNLDSEDFSKTEEYSWLYRNGIDYGFINRYTDDKFPITGIEADLTVYRFVGTENAQKMRSFGMCLEEYSDYCSYR